MSSGLSHTTLLSTMVTTQFDVTLSTAFVKFDPVARSLYVYLQPLGRRAARSIAAEGTTVVLDLDEEGAPLGIEVLLDDEQAAAFTKERRRP